MVPVALSECLLLLVKNKLVKFFNSTKMVYVIAGSNLNILFLKKREKNAPFMDDDSKTRGIK